jgi:hypothetical protein
LPRLRPVFLGTETLPDGTVRDRTVLVVDYVDPDHIPSYSEGLDKLADRGLPPVLVFAGPVDVSDGEAYATAAPTSPEPDRPVLVLGKDRIDATLMADGIDAPGEVWMFGADRLAVLPVGMHKPVVVRTPAYRVLDSEFKDRLESDLRRIQAKP